jgi:hypothetical protein
MKLLFIWLVGVPLAVAVICTTATLWPRGEITQRPAQARVAPHAVSVGWLQSDLQDVLTPVRQ